MIAQNGETIRAYVNNDIPSDQLYDISPIEIKTALSTTESRIKLTFKPLAIEIAASGFILNILSGAIKHVFESTTKADTDLIQITLDSRKLTYSISSG